MRINSWATVVAGIWLPIFIAHDVAAETVTIAGNDFDSLNTWGFTTDAPLFDNGADGFFGVTSASASGFDVINQLSDSFLGIRDLDDEGDNGGPSVRVDFESVSVVGFEDISAGFQYQLVDWDGTDAIDYEWFVDGVGQGVSTIGGQAGLSEFATISFAPPPGVPTSIGLSLTISQNGATDFAGLDGFQVSGSVAAVPEPRGMAQLAFLGLTLLPRFVRRRTSLIADH